MSIHEGNWHAAWTEERERAEKAEARADKWEALYDAVGARVAELDGQLSAVLAEAHLNATYTPTCAKAELVLLGTERTADSVSDERDG